MNLKGKNCEYVQKLDKDNMVEKFSLINLRLEQM